MSGRKSLKRLAKEAGMSTAEYRKYLREQRSTVMRERLRKTDKLHRALDQRITKSVNDK